MNWNIINPGAPRRVVVTKPLPGTRWIDLLTAEGFTVEICTSNDILPVEDLKRAIGTGCTAAIGQLTEPWNADLLEHFARAGGNVMSDYAVGYNNIDVAAATRLGVAIGNTPGVLTEATAEMGIALTFAAARRIAQSDPYTRQRQFEGMYPTLFLGELLTGKTVGVIGAGKIGSTYARMMVEGFKMNCLYFNRTPNSALEFYIAEYGNFLQTHGGEAVTCRRTGSIEELLKESDVVALFPPLTESTRHLINAERLALLKEYALLINMSRGPVVDENALVAYCRTHPHFRAGLDVYEREPELEEGLAELNNVTLTPHTGSSTRYSREGMATLCALNIIGYIRGYPLWNSTDMRPFLREKPPAYVPSILNLDQVRSTKG